MRRRVLKVACAIAVLFVAVCAGSIAYLRRSLPETDGAVSVAGITAPVEIVRDAGAVPHIFAATVPDALFGLGYVHAQDRLWQMEFQRRIGHGRLSEIFGGATVRQDRFLRTVGFGRAARTAWDRTPAWARERIDAYVAGINAYIGQARGSRLPPEFVVLRFEPEPWTGADVIAWIKMMAWDLSSNYSFELLRDDLVRAVGRDRMQQLMPPYAPDGVTILPRGGLAAVSTGRSSRVTNGAHSSAGSSLDAVTAALSRGDRSVAQLLLGGTLADSRGSNSWVVDGSLTASGRPLLANDTHLGSQIPSIWYLAHLSAGGFDLVGATLPGTPAIALGRNRDIAWGATNAYADVQDLFREQLDPGGKTARFGGADEPLTFVHETIRVRNGAPVEVDVRLTRHGPLISDAINASSDEDGRPPRTPLEPLALRWTALDPDDSTLPAFLKLNEARNWSEFTAALKDFVVPSQNFVYADVNGHIGYYAPGRIPIRARGDGTMPVEGWSGENEWTGWVPFEALPHTFDPDWHAIVTANNRQVPPNYPYNIAVDWGDQYRAVRITELLSRGRHFTPDDFARMQGDTVSVHARQLTPILLQRAHPITPLGRQALERLRRWDGDLDGGSSAAAVFEAWFLRLPARLVGDSLDSRVMSSYAGRLRFVAPFVTRTLADNDAVWCDDVRTPIVETCDDIVTAALEEGVADLAQRLGPDVSRWRWDAVHHAVFPHQGLDAVSALRPLLSRSVPTGGDWSTIDVGAVSTDAPYSQRVVAGYRGILDLSAVNDSRFAIDVGQSGHPLSRHYADFLEDWRSVRHRHIPIERADIERVANGRLRLEPRK